MYVFRFIALLNDKTKYMEIDKIKQMKIAKEKWIAVKKSKTLINIMMLKKLRKLVSTNYPKPANTLLSDGG